VYSHLSCMALTDLVESVDKCRYDGAVQLSLADKAERRNTLIAEPHSTTAV